MCGIYKIKNLINNKVYIGQSLDIKRRWQAHKNVQDDCAIHLAFKKYGIKNFSFEVLEECPPELLDEREIFWIKEYNSFNNGYNMTLGGSGSLKRSVECYDEKGNFLKSYNSITEAALDADTSCEQIISVCQHYEQRYFAGNYQWKYSNDNTLIQPRTKRASKEIYQFDKKGNFIKKFNSLTEVSKELKVDKSRICACCNGRQKTAYGFQWSYYPIQDQVSYIKQQKRPVQKFDLNGNFIKEYESISEAAKDNNTTPGNIGSVCQGNSKTCKGFIFKYK